MKRICSGASMTAANWPRGRIAKGKADEEASRISVASALVETPPQAAQHL
jgi:hypothetical protein